ncbi:hypothetical protein BDQ17DRAFT_1437871 [Cyathus striatus]|nr:hypothetical protein BDQ17DRAFT_1437871 [Cyathus striatus]
MVTTRKSSNTAAAAASASQEEAGGAVGCPRLKAEKVLAEENVSIAPPLYYDNTGSIKQTQLLP